MNTPLIYKDRPLFGLDIGFNSIKVMQVDISPKGMGIVGYGVTGFDPTAVKDGVIVNYEPVASAIKELIEQKLVGLMHSGRVVAAVPANHVYNRVMKLPRLKPKELDPAVRAETEQYIPLPMEELYLNYDITGATKDEYELLVVAAPKKLVDSYVTLFDILGLELGAIETTISASSRLVRLTESQDIPTLLIDFGSVAVDLTIFDKKMIVTGSVAGGGDIFTTLIANALDVSQSVAHTIKTKYGLDKSKKQMEIQTALRPQLDMLLKEVRRMIRYYEDRDQTKAQIGQIITMGGGANMPGLSEFLTDQLRIPCRMCNPWLNLHFSGLQPPNPVERSMYVTVAGLSLLQPKEIFA